MLVPRIVFLQPSEQSDQAIQNGHGVGWATGNKEIDRYDGLCAVVAFGMIDEGTSGNGTGAAGDDQFGVGDGGVGFEQGESHVFGDGSGDEKAVGMTRRGDELDPKAGEIETDRAENIGVGFARIASPGANLA